MSKYPLEASASGDQNLSEKNLAIPISESACVDLLKRKKKIAIINAAEIRAAREQLSFNSISLLLVNTDKVVFIEQLL